MQHRSSESASNSVSTSTAVSIRLFDGKERFALPLHVYFRRRRILEQRLSPVVDVIVRWT